MGVKVKWLTDPDNTTGCWDFFCPACGYGHSFDKRWTFNGNEERPTFSPSLLVHGLGQYPQCHSFVRDGYMEYQNDCGHEMRGLTVEIPDWDSW